MRYPSSKTAFPIFIAFAVAAVTYWHNDIFIDFADEGFLWYGSLQVLKHRVPILDFQAYDPGRYYWCAAVLAVFGKGLLSLRLAAGLFQWVGLSLGLLVLRRVIKGPVFLLLAGLLMTFYMLVPCRYFNASLPLIALFFAVRLVEKPSMRRHLAAGVCTGLLSFIAINHGFYVLSAFLSLMVYLRARNCLDRPAKKMLGFATGVLLGCLPWMLLFLVHPDFFAVNIDRLWMVASSFAAGKANVSLPVPWPWTVSWTEIGRSAPNLQAQILEYLNRTSIGTLFIFVILFYLVSALALIRFQRIQEGPRALFVASVFLGFIYLGHIFSRADLVYMGEGIFPVMAGLAALAALVRRPMAKRALGGVIALFVLISLLSAGLRSTIVFKTMVTKGGMIWYRVGKDRIWLTRADAQYCDNVKKLVSKYVRPDEPILLAPLLTTFYCLLEKESPVYELYFHIAPSKAIEQREVRQLEDKKVPWAIVGDIPIDGHPEQALSRSHPLLWGYLTQHYEVLTGEGLRPGYFLMRRKP